MRFSTTSIIAATTYLALSARALPHPASPATYNVVDVGGPTDAPEEPADVYETVKVTLPAQTTVTEAVPATTITTTPEHVVTVEAVTSTSTPPWTVVIGSVPTTLSSSSSSSCSTSSSTSSTSIRVSSSTSAPCTTSSTSAPAYSPIPAETTTHTADDGYYHPPGDNGHYRPYNPSATTYSMPSGTGHTPGVAAPTGWAAPCNATNSYVKRGVAAASGKMPSLVVVKHFDLL